MEKQFGTAITRIPKERPVNTVSLVLTAFVMLLEPEGESWVMYNLDVPEYTNPKYGKLN